MKKRYRLSDYNLLFEEENKTSQVLKGIGSKLKSLFSKKDKSVFDDIEKEDFVEVYFDRFDDYTKDIARKNYDKMRKKGTLEKTGLLKNLQTGGGGMGPESLLVSYLLVGHKDFKGMTQSEIEEELKNMYLAGAQHHIKSEINSFNQEYQNVVSGVVKNKDNRKIGEIVASVKNNITGQITHQNLKEVEFTIGDKRFLMLLNVAEISNLNAYKYGMIPQKGKGENVFAGTLRIKIGGKDFEIFHGKGQTHMAIDPKKKAQLSKYDGLVINGEKAYSYNSDGSPRASYPGAYEGFTSEVEQKLNSQDFSKEDVSTIISAVEEGLKAIGFDASIFKSKGKGREEVLIGADGKSIVGSENIDAHLRAKGIHIPDMGISINNEKKINEVQLSRGSLYRQRYYGRY